MSLSRVPSAYDFLDCSALSERGRCARLTLYTCQGEGCTFRRNHEEDIESLKNAYKRLASLSSYMQIYIAKKYYGGAMPWNEVKNIKTYKAIQRLGTSKDNEDKLLSKMGV